MILGLDVSHFQGNPNMGAIKASGRDFIVIKATEGVGYTDLSFAANRRAAHDAGLIVGIYHFARDNAPANEAAYFSGVVGALQTGEFLVLDQEVAHASGNVTWCQSWLDAVRANYGINPFIYMNQGSATGVASGNWSALAQTYGLWLARYDNAPTAQSTAAYWGAIAIKQFSDAGTVPGVAGGVDVDAFYGTTAQLLAYGYQPTNGDDMTPDQDARLRNVENLLGGLQNAVSDPNIGILKAVNDVRGKVVDSRFDLSGRPGPAADDLLGHLLSTRAAVAALSGQAAPVLDEAKLAAALLSDPASVDALGKAIAAHLKLASG